MMKNTKKLLITTIFLTVILLSSVYASFIPNTQAELTQQKGLNIIKNVVGLDLTKYAVSSKETLSSQESFYMGVVPQDTITYNLTSSGSEVNALCTFTNNSLQMIYVLQNQGTPYLTNPAISSNDVSTARSFLINYQTYTGDPLFEQLESTLTTIDATKNVTLSLGDKVLEVNASNSDTNFKWYYTANGALAPYSKFVSLDVKNGVLSSFVDNWNLYSVGSDSVSLSKEQAIQIALATAINHTWSIPLDKDTLAPQNFNQAKSVSWSTLTFDDSIGADLNRSVDQLELYPAWHIGLVLNKWYGQMYGIEVDVWADSGQVRSVQEAYSTLPAPQDVPTTNLNGQASQLPQTTSSLVLLISLPILALVVAGNAYFWMQKKGLHGLGLLKRRSVKTFGILLCILMASTVALGVVDAQTRGAYIWGARSIGAPGYNGNLSWRKTPSEITLQQETASGIAWDFNGNGWAATDHEGADSSQSQIITDIENLNTGYDYGAVVDFDHGVYGNPPWAPANENHYMFEDDYGTVVGGPAQPPATPPAGHIYDMGQAIYDMDINNILQGYNPNHPVVFAFINACLSANLTLGQGPNVYGDYNALGMPYAWTHQLVTAQPTSNPPPGYMSSDGYDYPDTGAHVYIGFPWGSASLSQTLPYNYNVYYFVWVDCFFYDALNFDLSVNQALDLASESCWGCSFYNSPLHQGFVASWPFDYGGNGNYYGNNFGNCVMAVYGNGNIHLKQYNPDYVTPPNVSGDTTGNPYDILNFGASSTSPTGHQLRYVFDWGDGSQTWTDWADSGNSVYETHSWSSGAIYTVTVTAESDDGAWSSPSYYTVNIGNQPVYHWITVNAYDDYLSAQLNPNVYVDNYFVGTAPVSIQVSQGYHTIAVDDPTWNPYWNDYSPFSYMTDNNNNQYSNGAYIAVYSDDTINAYYNPW